MRQGLKQIILVRAIRKMAEEGKYVSPTLAEILAFEIVGQPPTIKSASPLHSLQASADSLPGIYPLACMVSMTCSP